MKIDFNKLLDQLDIEIAKSNKWQEAFDNLSKVIIPSSYAPIIENGYPQSFIDGVASRSPELKEDLEYYTYEVPTMKTAIIEYKGKKYDAKKRKQFVKYLELIIKEHGK